METKESKKKTLDGFFPIEEKKEKVEDKKVNTSGKRNRHSQHVKKSFYYNWKD